MSIQPILGAALAASAVPVAWWAVSRPRPAGVDAATHLRRAVAGPTDLRDLDLLRGGGERVADPLVARLASAARRVTPQAAVRRVEHRLAAAGSSWPAERFFAVKVLLVSVGAVLGLVRLAAAPGLASILLAAGLAAAGWFVPDLVLRSRADQRTLRIRQQLPDTMDQVTIAVEAGLGFEAALARVAAGGIGPLSEELARTLQDVQLGVPRNEALSAMATRTGLTEVQRLVTAIQQSEKYGVPIARVLRVQSGELRERRRQRAEEQAMKIPVKVVLPLVFCILPTIFIVIIGPGVVRYLTSGMSDFG